jgi:hypothetical protein
LEKKDGSAEGTVGEAEKNLEREEGLLGETLRDRK